jgi:hypothetical protein|nr:MAG TPA: hypothetical protein [Caudoviricetes sp.]
MASYSEVNVKCPFFLRCDKQKISCEGPYDDCKCLNQIFKSTAGRNKQLEIFCNCNFEKCEIYRMICEAKY